MLNKIRDVTIENVPVTKVGLRGVKVRKCHDDKCKGVRGFWDSSQLLGIGE